MSYMKTLTETTYHRCVSRHLLRFHALSDVLAPRASTMKRYNVLEIQLPQNHSQ